MIIISENQCRRPLEVRNAGSTGCSPVNSQGNNCVSYMTALNPGHTGTFSHREYQPFPSRDDGEVAAVKITSTYA